MTQYIRVLSCISTILLTSSVAIGQTPSVRSVVAHLGQAKDVTFATAIQNEPIVADEEVCSVAKLTTKTILVTGHSLGTTNLFVVLDGGVIEAVSIEVVRDPLRFQRLEATIPTVVPGAQVTLTPVDATDKVVVSGTVKSCGDIRLVIQLLEDRQLPQSMIINQLRVRCCCCPCRTTRRFCRR
ncbi:hypothetical protein Pan97_39250 [Bremerella volcania]|uniref:Pilus formation protein N-terminal domain-containing protein n=1 Tax=Bremerella volcania TaxID=2527984 RepID=A0A518CCB8_9BACT|nr:hypothetical protein Pan97_39250 [Bremerella volcania]